MRKCGFQAILSSMVGLVGLILHIVLAGNNMQLLMVGRVLTTAFQGPVLDRLGPVLVQKCKKSRFQVFLSTLVNGIDFITYSTKYFLTIGNGFGSYWDGLTWVGFFSSFMSINGYNTAPEYIGSSFHPNFLYSWCASEVRDISYLKQNTSDEEN